MSAILLNRQNARHIGEVDIRLILQHIPQKIQINFLGFVVFSVLAENAVPFIDNHHKGPGRKTIHILHGPHQIFRIKIAEIRIFLQKLPENRSPDQADHLLHVSALAQELLHIQKNHMILVQMRFKILRFRDLQPGKELFRIASTAVISCQHGCGNGLSETPGTADADILLCRIKLFIGITEQSCFIHINFRIYHSLKSLISRIQITSHCARLLFQSCFRFYHSIPPDRCPQLPLSPSGFSTIRSMIPNSSGDSHFSP